MKQQVAAQTSGRDLIFQIVGHRLTELKQSRSYAAIIVLLLAAMFFTQDIYVDLVIEGKGLSHILLEAGIFIAVLLALAFAAKRIVDLYATITDTRSEVSRLKRHLTQVIRAEFEQWQLTASEKEIALLLIKGLSMREIADIRQVKEKSVRQQSTGIYTKARVANRHELSAYFIEDLLTPVVC